MLAVYVYQVCTWFWLLWWLLLQDISGFFLLCACTWPTIFFLGAFALEHYPPDVTEGERSALVTHPGVEEKGEEPGPPTEDYTHLQDPGVISGVTHPKNVDPIILDAVLESEHSSVWRLTLLKDLDFDLLMVSFLIFASALTLYINNMTTILLSYKVNISCCSHIRRIFHTTLI